ncbi:MAG: hypothetical protein GOMPHAMPRED_002387 [Gomphillus americanus]|uniref:SigF-like NTF2-like domain-containing protein n=1 Tax=Gomphillus americanus TaxID=1940652 RepID=A0A8H3IK32_9LECA|nr:MAG: hypothetical protein GOMPHAMPRED_002387 [Gomphillus americanus]
MYRELIVPKAFDAEKLVLYVTLHQFFRLFFLPPSLGARVQLTTKLKLCRTLVDNGANEKYHIVEQNDLYQTSEVVKFVDPLGILWVAFMAWNLAATLACLFGQWILAPVSWWEDTRVGRNLETGDEIERREKKTEIEKVD